MRRWLLETMAEESRDAVSGATPGKIEASAKIKIKSDRTDGMYRSASFEWCLCCLLFLSK